MCSSDLLESDAVLLGTDVSGLADILAGQGAATVYLGDDTSLEIDRKSVV